MCRLKESFVHFHLLSKDQKNPRHSNQIPGIFLAAKPACEPANSLAKPEGNMLF